MLLFSQVFTRDEALSESLHGLCCDPNTPVCMIRGLCPLMDVDLQLFSSKSIAKTHPDHEMEVREQVEKIVLILVQLQRYYAYSILSLINL